uniref:Uncharacterized protein n=1 Tax=Anguilla anguilla TaxID=7936 RepID=A0A0E9Q909_ANGAN
MLSKRYTRVVARLYDHLPRKKLCLASKH